MASPEESGKLFPRSNEWIYWPNVPVDYFNYRSFHRLMNIVYRRTVVRTTHPQFHMRQTCSQNNMIKITIKVVRFQPIRRCLLWWSTSYHGSVGEVSRRKPMAIQYTKKTVTNSLCLPTLWTYHPNCQPVDYFNHYGTDEIINRQIVLTTDFTDNIVY